MDRPGNSLVWAEMKYSPYWPAIICREPPKLRKIPRNKICVLFFGTKNYGFITPQNIVDYESNIAEFTNKSKGKDFLNAVKEIEQYSSDPSKFQSVIAPREEKVYVKIENDDSVAKLIPYDCNGTNKENTPVDSAQEPNIRLIEELKAIRTKYNDTFFELEKSKELLATVQAEKIALDDRYKQKDELIESLETDKKRLSEQLLTSNEQLVTLQNQLTTANKELSALRVTVDGLLQEKSALAETSKSKSEEVIALRKESQLLRAQITQIQSATKKPKSKDEEVYVVSKLLDHKYERNTRKFLVRWAGYDESHDSWVSEKDLNCNSLLKAYLKGKRLN